MSAELHVLIVDDSEDDALVTLRELKRGGYSPTFGRVDTAEAMTSALKDGPWDVIICDYIMPSFNGLAALNVFKASGLDLPFILVSGKVGEDKAVEAMKSGATDYVMKDNLNRLVPAIERGLYEVKVRRDSRKAEEALQQHEERFRALIENSSDAIAVINRDGTTQYVSPSLGRMLGEGRVGAGILEAVHPEDTQLVSDTFVRLLQYPSVTIQLEVRLRHEDSTWRTIEITVTNLLHDRAVEGIVINCRDITERKQAGEALQKSREEFRLIADFTYDWETWIDQNGNYLYVSPSCERITGYRAEEFLRDPELMARLVFPEDRATYNNHIQSGLVESAGFAEIDFRIQPRTGEIRWISHCCQSVFGSNGIWLGRRASNRDITERKKAEEALRESESHYRLLAENVSDVIWIMDTNFRYSYMSPSITHQRGYSVEEAMTQPLAENLTPASLETAMKLIVEEEAKERTGKYDPNRSINMEVEVSCKNGSTIWTENKVTYLRDSNGQITDYLGVSRDITERQQARKQLEQGLRKLERAMDGTIQAIALTVESRDRYTAGHQRRVAQLGCAIAQEMGFTSEQIQVIRIAGLLHDIGKISVPQEILSKPGKLTDIEFQLIKVHSQVGYDILKTVEFPWPIADIVIQHHERMNGSGYPSGIKEGEIILEARILGVADVVEAMNSYRSYRAPLGVDKALRQISRKRGVLYDPTVVDACVRLFTEKGFEFETEEDSDFED